MGFFLGGGGGAVGSRMCLSTEGEGGSGGPTHGGQTKKKAS